MPKPTLDDLAPGDVFASRYLLEAELGEGGFGRVFRARHTVTQARCALKVLRAEAMSHPAMRDRFATEVRAAGEIGSSHITAVHDVGVDASTDAPWIAMEYLQGETLEARIRRDGALRREDARWIFAQLGDAFGAAHDRGVLHLDLKPENLFLAETGVRGSQGPMLKVLDFGIARFLGDGRTHATVDTAIGSPRWMAPEQSEVGAHLRANTDVWAMGLLAFRVLTGKFYWRAAQKSSGMAALLMEVLTAPFERATARARALGVEHPDLPQGFDGWFAQCVERDAALRFQHGRAAMNALVQLLAGPVREETVMLSTPPRPPSLAPGAPYQESPAVMPTVALPTGPVPVMPSTGDGPAAAWRMKGECSLQLGMNAEAIVEFSRAIALNPRDPRTLRGRAQAWQALGKGELAAADEALAGLWGGA